MNLQDRVAIVTGAASGMGKAIAEMFAREGAKVVVSDINLEGAQKVAAAIQSGGGTAIAVKTNVAIAADVDAMLDTAVSSFGTLDVLVNNAGILDNMAAIGDVTDERWDQVFEVNVKGVMRAIRKALPIFLDKGRGVIVNTASTGGFCGAHAGAAYIASKHAVVGITKNTAFMYAQKGIRCNAIAPGATQTSIGAGIASMDEFGASRAGLTHALIPRTGQPEEIATVALFLASDASSFVNGAIVTADAGWTAAF